MEYVIFAVCLTVIVGLVLYAYHATQEKAASRIEVMYDRSLTFQQAVLQEIRLIRAQEATERAQMCAERTNIMGTVNNLIGTLRRENAANDEKLRHVIERLRIDLVQCVGDAAADALGHVKGEAVAIMGAGHKDGAEPVALGSTPVGSAQGG